MLDFKVKMTKGKTWSKLVPSDFITPKFLARVGKMLVSAIVYEARKDFAKQGGRPTGVGFGEGIPATEEFYKSFYYEVDGTTVEVFSSWPLIEQIIEGRRPYPMDWLTRQKGISRVPLKGPGGTVLIKSAPASPEDAWIHPGFLKHTFIRRGYERARRQMDKLLAEQVAQVLGGVNVT